jgi:hypothetical protein
MVSLNHDVTSLVEALLGPILKGSRFNEIWTKLSQRKAMNRPRKNEL